MTDSPANVKITKHNPAGKDGVYFDCGQDAVFSWDITFVGEGNASFIRPLADIVQTSATFYWREVGTENWNSIGVSGDVRNVTVPANTLPGRDIQWRVTPVVVGFTVMGDTSYMNAYPRIFPEAGATGLAGVSTQYPDRTLPWTGIFTTVTSEFTLGPDSYTNLLVKFAELPTAYRYKAIQTAGISFESVIGAGEKEGVNLFPLKTDFDETTVTWNTKPPASAGGGSYSYDNTGGSSVARVYPYIRIAYAGISSESVAEILSLNGRKLLLESAFMLQAYPWEQREDLGLRQGAFAIIAPVVRRAILIDVTVTSKPAAVSNNKGYVNPHILQTFDWQHVPDGEYFCLADWSTVSATFAWSNDDGATWHNVAAAANSQSVTLAADTMPEGTILWKVTATDDQGTTATSETYTISTVDSETSAVPVYPIQTIEDGDSPIVFRWEAVNDHATTPTGADLQTSTDGSTWSNLGSVTGSETSYTAAAEIFQTGTIYWRVRAYNADGVAGDWSDPVSFVAVASPPAPVVSVDPVPYATISWQSEGQQAYRVTVDGQVYGPYFGSDKSFQLPDYLSDGGHTASVEIQGSAGLWSKPGTVSFAVTNQPGAPIALRGTFYRDAELKWTTEDQTADFYVYRDGLQIGHASAKSFTDRTVLNGHSWQVINRLPGGYYTASNAVQGELRSCCTAIAPLSGGAWLDLRKSASESSEQSFAASRQISLRHFEGAAYPVAEISPFLDLSGSYDVAFLYGEESAAAQFEAMLGQTVILKSRGGECLVGILSGFAKRNPRFYRSYSFSVQRIHWRDYVDENA